MKLRNVTIGADPELFIINEKTKKVVSAVGLIPGEKGNPWRSDDMPEGFGLGFERCVMYLTGMGNIRDVIPFPRTVKNCEL